MSQVGYFKPNLMKRHDAGREKTDGYGIVKQSASHVDDDDDDMHITKAKAMVIAKLSI